MSDATQALLLDTCALTWLVNGDPADRIIISTARRRSIPVVTRDAKIIAYAQAGHVGVVPC